MKNRKIVAKNRSGGVILGYRQEIASKIKPLHTIVQPFLNPTTVKTYNI
jgi:hypothetical protein